jgi:hypothetical protein
MRAQVRNCYISVDGCLRCDLLPSTLMKLVLIIGVIRLGLHTVACEQLRLAADKIL